MAQMSFVANWLRNGLHVDLSFISSHTLMDRFTGTELILGREINLNYRDLGSIILLNPFGNDSVITTSPLIKF